MEATMTTQTHLVSPSALANARATVDVTHAGGIHPGIIGGAWATMLAAKGQTFRPDRLEPAHLIETTRAPDAEADHLAEITARAMDRARTRIAFLHDAPKRGSGA